MKTPLQILVQGPEISGYEVSIEGGKGVKATGIHKADSPNYLFIDVKIDASAQPGTYYIVFSREGQAVAEKGTAASSSRSARGRALRLLR